VAACAIPLALIGAGVDLDLGHLRVHPRIITATVLLKLVLVPAATWGLCRLLGVDQASTFCAVVLMASPTAIASVPMARLLGGDPGLMAALVTATTVAAPASMLGWLLLVGP
jgi:malonate transporter